MRTKEQIIEAMCIEMPFHLNQNVRPYILESMDIYGAQRFDQGYEKATSEACKEIEKNYHPNRNTY